MRLSATQRQILDNVRAGKRLWWFGSAGPVFFGNTRPHYPQKRTVLALLSRGILKWGKPLNKTQDECGIYPLELPCD